LPNAGRIHLRDQVASEKGLRLTDYAGDSGAEQMLVTVHSRRILRKSSRRCQKKDREQAETPQSNFHLYSKIRKWCAFIDSRSSSFSTAIATYVA
jgi:hypothetical protein